MMILVILRVGFYPLLSIVKILEMIKISNSKVENKIQELVMPIIEKNNYELVDIEFLKEGSNWYLRIYADKEGGFTIDDCELVSKELSSILEEEDPIKQAYILEVSSPGLDRPLKKEKDFIKYAGEIVDLKLYKPFNKRKEFQGILKGLENNIVTIEEETGELLEFDRNDIAIIRLAVIF